MNSFDYRNILIYQPEGPPIIDFPWGSLFALKVILPGKSERFHIDHVRPFWRYIQYGLFSDFRFTIKILAKFVYYFFRTRLFETWRRQASVWATLAILREEFGWVGHFDELVEKWMRRSRGVDIIITGHSHEPRVKRILGERLYLNTGTWTHMISLDIHRLGQQNGLTYVAIEYDNDGRPQANLLRWHGKPREKEVIFYQP
jgi:hypothetical protein